MPCQSFILKFLCFYQFLIFSMWNFWLSCMPCETDAAVKRLNTCMFVCLFVCLFVCVYACVSWHCSLRWGAYRRVSTHLWMHINQAPHHSHTKQSRHFNHWKCQLELQLFRDEVQDFHRKPDGSTASVSVFKRSVQCWRIARSGRRTRLVCLAQFLQHLSEW